MRIKVVTTGRNMVLDIVEAAYRAGMRDRYKEVLHGQPELRLPLQNHTSS